MQKNGNKNIVPVCLSFLLDGLHSILWGKTFDFVYLSKTCQTKVSNDSSSKRSYLSVQTFWDVGENEPRKIEEFLPFFRITFGSIGWNKMEHPK